jgi:hypothetical protein
MLALGACLAVGASFASPAETSGGAARSHLRIGSVELEPARPDDPTAGQRRHEVSLRRSLGLDASPSHVRALHEEPEVLHAVASEGDDLAGLVATPDEARKIVRRGALSRQAGIVESWARRHAPDRFAGLSIGAHVEGAPRLVVRFSGPIDRGLRAAVRALVPDGLASSVDVRSANHDLRWLTRRQQSVSSVLDGAQRTAGIESAGSSIDVERNEVVVYAPGDPTRLRDALRSGIGLEAIRVEGGAGHPRDAVDKDDALAFLLVEGGQRIEVPAGDSGCLAFVLGGRCGLTGYCTSGFAAKSPVYGNFILTAGHCVKVGDTVRQGDTKIGKVAARKVGGMYDVAMIADTERNQIGRIHIDSTHWFEPVHWLVGTNDDPVGSVVCHSGVKTTGISGNANRSDRCGTITSRTYAPPRDVCPDVPCVGAFRLATYEHGPGDSGAPVYWNTVYGRGAVGLHKGSGPHGEGVFSHLPYAMRDWGLKLTKP